MTKAWISRNIVGAWPLLFPIGIVVLLYTSITAFIVVSLGLTVLLIAADRQSWRPTGYLIVAGLALYGLVVLVERGWK